MLSNIKVKKIRVRDILDYLDAQNEIYDFQGNKDSEIIKFCSVKDIKDDAIIWVKNAFWDEQKLRKYRNLLVLTEPGIKTDLDNLSIIFVQNVRRTYFRIIKRFWEDCDPENKLKGITTTSVIETLKIGRNLCVGHHTYIGEDVEIGDDVKIYHNVTIVGRVHIGNHTIIESGTVIGVCGFGYDYDEEGNPEELPHLGGVWIGNNVKIGANSAIARGTLSDTIIEDNVKIDNLCHIAHNDIIKRNVMLAANAVVSGSAIIGANVWLAPGSLINDNISIGDNAFMGLGAVVTKDVQPNKVMVGVPVREIRDRF